MGEGDISVHIPESTKIKFESEFNKDGLFIGYKAIYYKFGDN